MGGPEFRRPAANWSLDRLIFSAVADRSDESFLLVQVSNQPELVLGNGTTILPDRWFNLQWRFRFCLWSRFRQEVQESLPMLSIGESVKYQKTAIPLAKLHSQGLNFGGAHRCPG